VDDVQAKLDAVMNDIRKQTDRIPGDMKQVLNILLNMQDDQEVAAVLPISLKSLEDVAFNKNIQRRKDTIENEFGVIVNNPAVTQYERKEISMEAKRVVEAGRSDVGSVGPPPPFLCRR